MHATNVIIKNGVTPPTMNEEQKEDDLTPNCQDFMSIANVINLAIDHR